MQNLSVDSNSIYVLVAGGAGYIGSHVAKLLFENGFVPIIIDNLIGGHKWAVRNSLFIECDIDDEQFIKDICVKYKPIALIHLAAFIEATESLKYPDKFWHNNFYKAKKLFRIVQSCNVRNIVFSSTAAVYGYSEGIDLFSERSLLNPINTYGETKLATENFLRELNNDNINSMTLRYFNAAGATADAGLGEAHWPESHLIPRVILAALGYEKAVNIFGLDYPTPDGTAVRDYIHVNDLSSAHVLALKYLINGGKTDVCNLGTGIGYSVKEIINAVENYMECKIPVIFSERRKGDPAILVADPRKAKTVLNWKAERSFENIISSAVDWHKSDLYKKTIIDKYY